MVVVRDLDARVAEEVFGHSVKRDDLRNYIEVTPDGERPLPLYSSEISSAWAVVEKMAITLVPVEGGYWFAVVGPEGGWRNPADFFGRIQSGQLLGAGAAVGESMAHTVCLAALKAFENRRQAAAGEALGFKSAAE